MTLFLIEPMVFILTAVEAALMRAKPSHKVPFHLLWLYVLDPPSEYLVHVETLAGVRTTFDTLTPTSTIRHVQCAYRAAQLVKYLASKQHVVPPSFCHKVADKLYKVGYVVPENFWTDTLELTSPKLLQAIKEGPTDFTDTFAVQLCALSTLDKRIQLSITTLGQLNLGSNVPLTLTVTIRPDLALYDAAPKHSAELEARLIERDQLLAGRAPALSVSLDDRPLVFEAVRINCVIFYYAHEALRNDRDIVLATVQQNGRALRDASAALKNDHDIVLAAVQHTGLVLEFASTALQNDRSIVLAAVRQNGRALKFASAALRSDHDIVMAAVQQKGSTLIFVSAALRKDREVILASVQQYSRALEFASTTLKNDREIVLTAVQRDGLMLRYASAMLKNDRKIVLAAVRQNGRALRYASTTLIRDRAIALAAALQTD